MPTYDYECSACGHAFELFQSISAAPKRKCPSCGVHKVKRLIGTGGGIIFKGSGFYQTDYRSESYKKGAEADSKSSKKSDKSDDGGGKKGKGSASDSSSDKSAK
jgi:putative FmdB family regulatory protein